MAKWKVLKGILFDPTAKAVHLIEVEGFERVPNSFYPGDVIETDRDLEKINTPLQLRYERLPDDPVEEGSLEGMTVAELRKLAEVEEIDLGTAVRKDEILHTIRGALQEA